MMPLNLALKQNPVTGKYQSNWNPFPLREEYFIAAKMALDTIFPRPNIETQSHAGHRWAHSQMLHEIPIGVQGGAWPFKYEIIYDETGLGQIGSFYGQANYGVISFNPATLNQLQEYAYTVRVIGQDGVYVDVSRTFTPDDSMHIFVQKGYAGTKLGTITQPLEDIKDWYKDSSTDATYANKKIVFRTGTYSATGNSTANPANIVLSTPYKTPSLMAFPGEAAVWDMTNAKIYDASGISDVFVNGITFDGYRADVANAHHFWMAGAWNRMTFFRCTFKNIGAGTAGTDNTSPIFSGIAGGNTIKNYFYLVDCVYDGVSNASGGNGSYVDLYQVDHFLWERNIAKNSTTTQGFWAKCTRSFGSIRGNLAVENCSGTQISALLGSESGGAPNNMEVCWNICRAPGSAVFTYATSTSFNGQYFNHWIYRNTFIGLSVTALNDGLTPVYSDANVICADTLTNWVPNNASPRIPDVIAAQSSTIVNSLGRLTGPTGFGTNGGEVY